MDSKINSNFVRYLFQPKEREGGKGGKGDRYWGVGGDLEYLGRRGEGVGRVYTGRGEGINK